MPAQTLSETLVAELRGELARQRKTFGQLAIMLGVAPATISDRMSGKTQFTIEELDKAARWLDVPPWQLICPRSARNAA